MRFVVVLLCSLIAATAFAQAQPVVNGTIVGLKRMRGLTTTLTVEISNRGDRPVRVTEVRLVGCGGTGQATIAGGMKVPAHATRRQRLAITVTTPNVITADCTPDHTWKPDLDLTFTTL